MIIHVLELLQNFTYNVFFTSAIIGTTLFVLRMLMSLIGDSLHIDDTEMDFNDHHDHVIPSFKLFTLHSISGFLMMFGLVGLACHEQYNLFYGYSFIGAFLAGFLTMIFVALLFKGILALESPGDVFSSHKTKGLTATVYQRIPIGGQGKVHVVMNGIARELLAQSVDKMAIESFTTVKIVNVLNYDLVEVIPLNEDAPHG